ncbi:DUF998 domain-containing protein [Actinoplanes sp. NPDC051494]|uniref:DUF998 domain-containing protein n=1 Tax=Actinoplanes sp. NPDC051494 TaxID=3363907 RepID=UPI003788D253
MPEPTNAPGTRRLAAVAALLLVPAGAVTMLAGLVAAPGSWLAGYVSEAGVTGMPLASPYRWGLIALACGVALLGGALRHLSGRVAPVLGAAAVFAAGSAVVPCATTCALPPFEPTTVADVVHSAAAVAGLVLLAGAMALIAWSPEFRPAQRRLAAASAALIVPSGAALALTMLLVGRGTLGAYLERVVLVIAVSWLTGAAQLTVLSPAAEEARQADRDKNPVRSR